MPFQNLKRPVTGGDDDEQQDDLGGWQKLIIPVDLPFMHVSFRSLECLGPPSHVSSQILCAVEVNLQGDLDSIYAGQPVAVCVEISSSFHWGAVLDPATKEYNMRYVVQESVTDWLVSGHKRGDFVATVSIVSAVYSGLSHLRASSGRRFSLGELDPGASPSRRAIAPHDCRDPFTDELWAGHAICERGASVHRDISRQGSAENHGPPSRWEEHVCCGDEWRYVTNRRALCWH